MTDDSGQGLAEGQDPYKLEEDQTPYELDGRPAHSTGGVEGPDLSASELVTAGRERHRHRLAWALLALVAASVAVMFWGAFVVDSAQWERLDRVGTLIVVPLLTLLGTAVGWYYGGRRDGDGL